MLQATDTHTQAMLDTLLSRKGQIVTVTTLRDCKVRKGQDPVRKQSTFQCRVGVNYDNIQAVKDKRAEGTLPKENAGLPWGEWALFPYVITHKGEYYVRCTVLRNAHRSSPVYTQLGATITREQAQLVCLASEFKQDADNDVFTVKVSSLVEIR